MPKISICVPTYNNAPYLAEMINSVRGQTYKDWELIIVDDGSTDSTRKLMEFYADDKQIRYYHRSVNKGISATRNEAVSYAQGKYIAVFDGDDIMHPDRLKKELKKIEKGYDFVYSYYYIANQEAMLTQNSLMVPPEKLTYEGVIGGYTAPHITIMAKRECFIDNGYENQYRVNDDLILVLKWLDAGYKYAVVKEPLCIARWRGGSVSNNKKTGEQVRKITEEMRKKYL